MNFQGLLAAVDQAARGFLGGDVTYTPTVGSPVTVDGIFDAAYVRVDLGQAGVSSSGPAVFLTLSDLPSDPSVDLTATVTVNGVVYVPHERQPDGQGAIVLLLHKV